jgi:hypothetical protein
VQRRRLGRPSVSWPPDGRIESQVNKVPAMSEDGLVSLDVSVSGSQRHGRAFVILDVLRRTSEKAIGSLLSAHFVEEDDIERLPLLERALSQSTVTVETYPGEAPPHELHAYVVAPKVSDTPVFACVLAPLALVHSLATEPPHIVLETASFQVIDGDLTHAAIVSAIESWVRRVWPAIRVPAVQLSPWPAHVDSADAVAARHKLRWFPVKVGTVDAGPASFSPPSDLVDSGRAA